MPDSSESWIITTNEAEIPEGAIRDTDVLDTWFSSALYPLVALGWPKVNNANVNTHVGGFENYVVARKWKQTIFPFQVERPAQLDVMETGHDILYFWLARMTFISLALTEQAPFKKAVFHGLLRDTQGRKMSKSLGNAVDPLHIIEGASMKELKDKVIIIIIPRKAFHLFKIDKDINTRITTTL